VSAEILPLFKGELIVKAKLNNVDINILIDTGFSGTFWLSSTLIGAKGYVNIDNICIGRMCFSNVPSYAQDTPFSDADKTKTNGLLGMEILKYFSLEIVNSKIIHLNNNMDNQCDGNKTALTFDSFGRPFFDAKIDGLLFPNFLLDTGALYSLLSPETVDHLTPYIKEGAETAGGCDINGCTDSGKKIANLKEFCLGKACANNIKVKYPVWDAAGMTFFSQFRAIFNFLTNELHLCGDAIRF
jgi:predicted aspartyl protease